MPLNDLVAPNAIIPALKVNGKKQALQELAAKAAELSGLSERTIFEILVPLFNLKFLMEFAAGGVGTSNWRH